jgi:ABC transport system ATP-binding/permease protein
MNSWLIGSADDCDLVVEHDLVSSHHCRLTKISDGFLIEDLHSSNGTYVNGERIETKQRVFPTDRVTLGTRIPLPWPEASGVRASRIITIGRDASNDVVLDVPTVSMRHARLLIDDDQMTLDDIGSTNGTFLNSPTDRITSAPVCENDVVYFGTLRVSVKRLLGKEQTKGSGLVETTLHKVGQNVVVGRDPKCDHVLDDPMVSWRHARVWRTGESFHVEDLGSTNGTYVNGQQISGRTPLRVGDVIALASYTFKLTETGALERRDFRDNITLEAKQVTIDVPGKRLLEDVSLTIFPGEFVGLMGPSGAGKSTLIGALGGYTPPAAGMVLFSGQDVYANYDRFRGQIGYVPQDDIIHPDLTVGQALYYTARLRLPSDFSDEEIHKRIKNVLAQLGLVGTENVLIGSPEKKGISGGQRKRVNLAMELLTDPSVLLLDEPTSGLSSEDALMVMRVLRSLADSGKTLLLTIHQPSLEAFRLMDHLIVVGRDAGAAEPGRLAYFGPAFPDSVKFFNPREAPSIVDTPLSPDDALRGLSKRPMTEWLARYEQSDYHQRFVVERSGKRPVPALPGSKVGSRASVGLLQWWTLSRRCLSIVAKDSWNTALLLVQAPIIAMLIALVFGQEASGDDSVQDWPTVAKATSTTLFLLALSAIWFGCSNAARQIVAEWAIYRRERMVNLRVPAYVASKFTVLGFLCVFQCAVLLAIVHLGSGLHGSWLAMYGVLLLAALVGVGLGLMISAVARSSEMAIASLPIVILPMVILGGVLHPIEKMGTATLALCQTMPSRWAFESLLLLEAAERPKWRPAEALASAARPAGAGNGASFLPDPSAAALPDEASRDMAEAFFRKKHERMGVLAAVTALSGMLVVLASSIWLVLRLRDIH